MLQGWQAPAGVGPSRPDPQPRANPFANNDYYDLFYADNPTAAYQRTLNQWGVGGGDSAFDRFLRQQSGQEYLQYQAQAPDLPRGTTFLDFLNPRLGSIEQRFRALPAQARGYNYGNDAPRVRYLL